MSNDDVPRSLRNWKVSAFSAGILTIVSLWLGVIVSAALSIKKPGGVVLLVIVGPPFLLAAGAALRTLFLRLELGPERVTAHNYLRNRSVRWSDLQGVLISTNAAYGGGLFYVAVLQTKAGLEVPVRGLTSRSDDLIEWYASQIVRASPPGSGAFL